jgi:uncharacterized damage-inducible protein DinB
MISTMFKYKAWANEQLLAAIPSIDDPAHASERSAVVYILNHTFIVDRIFAGHLVGAAHGYSTTTATENPAVEELAKAIKASDAWYVDFAATKTQDQLTEELDFTFTDGKPGRMSREEMLAHVLMHGAYHRGGIGRIMSQISVAPPRDVFTGFLHTTQAALRRR